MIKEKAESPFNIPERWSDFESKIKNKSNNVRKELVTEELEETARYLQKYLRSNYPKDLHCKIDWSEDYIPKLEVSLFKKKYLFGVGCETLLILKGDVYQREFDATLDIYSPKMEDIARDINELFFGGKLKMIEHYK